MGALHAAFLKSAADGPRAGRYTDFSGPRGRLQKSAKIGKNYEKINFPYNNFPKKDISLRKCTKKRSPSAERKKTRGFGATPLRHLPLPGVLHRFLNSVPGGLGPSLESSERKGRLGKNFQFFFAEGDVFFVHFLKEMAFLGSC